MLYRENDGLKWNWVIEYRLPDNRYASETTLQFLQDGEIAALVRPESNGRRRGCLHQTVLDTDAGVTLACCEGHEDWVLDVTFSPDGGRLASTSRDRTVRLWSAKTGEELARLVHPEDVNRVVFSPDGGRLASGSDDWTVRVWDAVSGRQLSQCVGQSRAGWSLAFSPDGQLIASGSEDKTVRLWNTETGEELARLAHSTAVCSVVFSPRRTLSRQRLIQNGAVVGRGAENRNRPL